MKLILPSFFFMVLFLLTPVLLLAQKGKDYNIYLNSGKFLPVENSSTINKSSVILTNSRFSNEHFVVIQFVNLPTNAEKAALRAGGIVLGDYLPQNAFIAIISQSFDVNVLHQANIRSVLQLRPEQKTVPQLLKGNFPSHAIRQAGMVDLTVTTYAKFSAAELSTTFSALGITVLEDMPMFKSFTLRIPQQNVQQLVSQPFIQWVEPIDPPNVLENLPGRSLHRVNVLNDGVRNLKGSGINIGIWDGDEVAPHLDFAPTADRVVIIEAGTPIDHATHCAGTLGSAGILNPRARGMASKSKIYSWNFNGNIPAEQAAAIPGQNLSVSSHSYGAGGNPSCGVTGASVAYSTTSRNTDINMNNNPNHLHIHSSGNSQSACPGGWSTITGSGKTAKNNILVGDITSAEALSGSSSNGPAADGRVKPEIVSMGTGVLSTLPNNSYATFSGTSMATPGVAGSVALLIERFRQLNAGADPISSLIKNAVLNTAHDLGNAGPDYRYGYGRLNALSAVKILEQNRYAVNTISTGGTNNLTVTVPASAARLRVMITWNDPAGTANANPALVNNLDLSVVNGATTTLPFILDPIDPGTAAIRGVDNVSNIEQVVIDNPAAGTYTLQVTGAAVPVGPQQYSITWEVEQPYIEMIYPNGGEFFNPGTTETITWNSAGVSSAQTLEYSLNNGTTWTLISNTVSPNTTRFNWVPAAGSNTATALIRVSSGALTDVSDVNFHILGTPTALTTTASCAAGELNFSWSPVTGATEYNISKLNQTTGAWTVVGNNISGTTFSLAGLVAGTTEWFNIIAKSNSSNARSERSVAISRVVPDNGVGAIGTITGSTVICGAASNIPYSIDPLPNATSYTWTVPAGANIASGQGTNNILVNYPAGSTSGNVTAFASAGTCQSATSSLAISVSSTGTAAPVSGGNQSQTHCMPSQIPTLTATATVPSGHVVIWYDAATNGNVVSSPTLNSIGSITYFAASRNSTTLCESASRVLVTLTITSAAAPTIIANGPLVFCQGASVVLTASAGTAYTWSNGATTQSITVTASGNYSVIVNQGNGCISSSAATTVTVNPLPTINIAAGSSTTFCQGGSVTLTATTGNSYLWSNSATTQSITVNTSGSYSVTVNQGNGCINTSAATVVTVNALPVATIIAGGATSFCEGGAVMLTASTGTSYAWSNGATTQSINVTGSGNYSVIVTNANGCSAASTPTAVTVTPKPSVSLAAAPYTRLFPGITTNITATTSVPVTYTWLKNGTVVPGANATSIPVNIDNVGSYSVQVTNASGCSNVSSAIIISDSVTARIFIYPNPNNGVFQVSYYNATPTENTVSVFDARGARIITKKFGISSAYQRMNVDVRNHGKGSFNVVLSDKNNKKLATATVVVL